MQIKIIQIMLLIGQMQTIIQINVTLITRHQRGNKAAEEAIPGGRDAAGCFSFFILHIYKSGFYFTELLRIIKQPKRRKNT